MCARAGLKGTVELRPYLYLERAEVEAAGHGSIVMQTGSLGARFPMANKQWPPERFQEVADALSPHHEIVQLGSTEDYPLAGARDLRGRTTLREAAAVLAGARLFVGLVGGLMHLARAVDCRAVIVYGGRETPQLSGYIANENLSTSPPCAPCWQRNRCDYGRRCLEEIHPPEVLAAIARQLALFGQSLPVEEFCLAPD
jgi:ADP-heptose:LPS heptosyltransferase